jgi:hypothetical protein
MANGIHAKNVAQKWRECGAKRLFAPLWMAQINLTAINDVALCADFTPGTG